MNPNRDWCQLQNRLICTERIHRIHEMGHVLDNLTGSSRLASILGGGPSDDMARELDGSPEDCFWRYNCADFWQTLVEEPPTEYGKRGPSEDFADTFMLSVTSPGILRTDAPLRAEWMEDFARSLGGSRGPFEGQPYRSLYFVPRDAPVPDCSLPYVDVTPEPPIVSTPEPPE